MLKRSNKKIIFILFLLAGICQITASANPNTPLSELYANQGKGQGLDMAFNIEKEPSYLEIKSGYDLDDLDYDKNQIVIRSDENVTAGSGNKETMKIEKDNKTGILSNEETPVLDWNFNVENAGYYEIWFEYIPYEGTGAEIRRKIKVDGSVLFSEMNSIVFDRKYMDEPKTVKNNIGDEVSPRQIIIEEWDLMPVKDADGFYSQPFLFYFEKGEHSISLEYIKQSLLIGDIYLKSPEEVLSYKEVYAEYLKKGYKAVDEGITVQAENSSLKNSSTVTKETDQDPATQPLSRGNKVLNILGGISYREGSQYVEWEIEVAKSGLYNIGIKLLNNWNDGLPTHRQLKIDGKVPFTEMLCYRINYSRQWQMEVLSDEEGNPYLFYLSEGKHTIRLEVVKDEITPIIEGLNENAMFLSEMLLKIFMLTGSDPDPNYDYDLEKKMPNLLPDLKSLADNLSDRIKEIEEISGEETSVANTIKMNIDTLEEMAADPDIIAVKLDDLKTAQNSIGSAIAALESQPLAIDYFKIGNYKDEKENWENVNSNIFERAYTTIYNLIRSYTVDYSAIGSIYEEGVEIKTSIEIWLSRGREWGEILKRMADENFTPKTGIAINVNIVPANQLNAGTATKTSTTKGKVPSLNLLMLAASAGKVPDVVSGSSSSTPVEFAIRDVVYDLTEFDDYDDVAGRFLSTMHVPYEYEGGQFAIPETMNFKMFFYRKDIFDALGLNVPSTWDELYQDLLPVLYQNNMVFLFSPDFSPFLYQNGGDYYTKDKMYSALDTPEAFRAFKEFTGLYTNYGVPAVSQSFYVSFRSGEAPAGISDFNFYMQLLVSAPELAGRWEIAQLPGKEKENGTVDRSIAGVTGSTIMITEDSDKKDESWEFIKWWTSSEVQTKFAVQLESVMGEAARWNTANVESFKNLGWKKEHLEKSINQFEWYKEVPVVLGGYYTSRAMTNAWTDVVLGGKPIRDSLEYWVKEINKEMANKQQEYGKK